MLRAEIITFIYIQIKRVKTTRETWSLKQFVADRPVIRAMVPLFSRLFRRHSPLPDDLDSAVWVLDPVRFPEALRPSQFC